MNGFAGSDLAGAAATWIGALLTLAVWSYAVGERRIFALLQHLLAGLATGYLLLLAIHDVLVPRLISPLLQSPGEQLVVLLPALALVGVLAAASWLPRRATTPATAVLIGATAAFALGGAVVGTILPQMTAALPTDAAGGPGVLGEALSLGITILVLSAFLRGSRKGQLVAQAAIVGRWLLVGGIGGWLGFLLVSRLSLLVDRIAFILGDWLTVLR
jgi:hypothetical protein